MAKMIEFKKTMPNDEFNKFIETNLDLIMSITPKNPTVPVDDEWNDDIYDSYAKIDNDRK